MNDLYVGAMRREGSGTARLNPGAGHSSPSSTAGVSRRHGRTFAATSFHNSKRFLLIELWDNFFFSPHPLSRWLMYSFSTLSSVPRHNPSPLLVASRSPPSFFNENFFFFFFFLRAGSQWWGVAVSNGRVSLRWACKDQAAI